MNYKCIQLRGVDASAIKTEIMYEVAAARVSGAELLRVNIHCDEELLQNKVISALLRILKGMKSAGTIQFFATESSFAQRSMEAEFLLNKYPTLALDDQETDDQSYVYVKI